MPTNSRRSAKSSWDSFLLRRFVVRENEFAQLRIHHGAPAASRENTVVAGFLRHVVAFVLRRNTGAQVMRRARLAAARNVVEVAFNGQQRRVLDVLRAHQFTVHVPRALGQSGLLEYDTDGVKVV